MAMHGHAPILVAGKTGQLARSLAEEAVRRGVPLVAMERPHLDLTDPGAVERAVAATAPRAIINAAAYTAVDQAEAEPALAFALNRDGAARLAAAAAQRDVPFIHVSTDYVFDGRKDAPYREDDAPSPLGVYGRSKLEGERAVRETCPAAVILRTSWLYGRFGRNFVTTMLQLAQTRELVRVVDDQHGAPTAARDLARAILDLTERMVGADTRGCAGIYHIAAQGETTWHGFAAAIFAGWARRGHRVPALQSITTAEYKAAARRPKNSRLDCSRIERAFGLRLPPWQGSLDSCLDELAGACVEAQR
jgi:dTDP-4-dehydrorhamnose reductase